MYFLVEKDAEGNAVNRYNLDTDTSLTKAVLIQILKAAHDNPDRYEVIEDKNAPPHPSDGIEPKEHCQERVDMITQAGLDLKKRFKRKKPFRPGISEYTD